MKTETQRNLEQYLDHNVVDQTGKKIGTLQCIWSDHQGEPAFLGIQTGWLFGKTHVVPAQRADVNEQSRTIRLPYPAEKIKDAPSYDPGVELDESTEREVRSFYNISSQPATRESAPAGTRGQEAATV